MVRRLLQGKWAALAAMLLLAQPVLAQKTGLAPEEESALDEAANVLEGVTLSPAPPAAPRPQPEPRPALWLLQDADTKIYLFGTIHILPPGYRWRSAAVDRAIGQADELVIEVSDRDMADNAALLIGPMMLGKQAPLAWRVSPGRREALARMMAELQVPAEMLNSMQSWAAAMVIMAMSAVQGMGDGGDVPVSLANMPGVEDGLETEFRARSRPISGVETMAQQMGFFSNLSFASQRELLESMIDDYARATGDPAELYDIDEWVRGHPEAIAIETSAMPPVLYDALLTRRNRTWTDWLIARLDRPGTILFAVGAGHLAGPDSVQTMLTGRGFTATRVD